MKYLFIVIVLLIAGGGFFLLNNQTSQKPTSSIEKSATTEEKKETIEVNTSELSNRYLDYSSDNFAKATAKNGKTVLFFAALAWCPSCQAADKDFKANFDKVPSDVTILKVDYDTADDLKKQYAITMQDTFVQVDSQGKEIARWNGGGQGVAALLANAK